MTRSLLRLKGRTLVCPGSPCAGSVPTTSAGDQGARVCRERPSGLATTNFRGQGTEPHPELPLPSPWDLGEASVPLCPHLSYSSLNGVRGALKGSVGREQGPASAGAPGRVTRLSTSGRNPLLWQVPSSRSTSGRIRPGPPAGSSSGVRPCTDPSSLPRWPSLGQPSTWPSRLPCNCFYEKDSSRTKSSHFLIILGDLQCPFHLWLGKEGGWSPLFNPPGTHPVISSP